MSDQLPIESTGHRYRSDAISGNSTVIAQHHRSDTASLCIKRDAGEWGHHSALQCINAGSIYYRTKARPNYHPTERNSTKTDTKHTHTHTHTYTGAGWSELVNGSAGTAGRSYELSRDRTPLSICAGIGWSRDRLCVAARLDFRVPGRPYYSRFVIIKAGVIVPGGTRRGRIDAQMFGST